MDQTLVAAKNGDADAVIRLVDHCNRPLMKVWNQYRTRMKQRGVETMDVRQQVMLIALSQIADFRGTTICEFCSWLRTILYRLIWQQLHRPNPHGFASSLEPPKGVTLTGELRQECQQVRKVCQQQAYLLALDHLEPLDRMLIVLHARDGLTYQQVCEKIKTEHPKIWDEHKEELEKNPAYCFQKAKTNLEEIATLIDELLWALHEDHDRCAQHLEE